MNIFVTGSNGMLGSSLCEVLSKRHVIIDAERKVLDVTNPAEWTKFELQTLKDIDVIIHCAAYTQVDAAEQMQNRDVLMRTNVQSVDALCNLCLKYNIRLIFPQTFLILRSQDEIHSENSSLIEPLSWYAKSKWEAEKVIRKRLPPELRMIIRMGGFYGGGPDRDKNFVGLFLNKILPNAILRGEKSIAIGDRVWQPTWINDISQAIDWALSEPWFDSYQYAPDGYTSFAELAETIVTNLGIQEIKINKISSDKVSEIAPRPQKIIMNSSDAFIKSNFVHDYKSRLDCYLRESWLNYDIKHL